jgi:hypothetical protein
VNTPNTDQLGCNGENGASYLPGKEAGLAFLPERTALPVIDPVNDFLSEGGAGWDLVKKWSATSSVP